MDNDNGEHDDDEGIAHANRSGAMGKEGKDISGSREGAADWRQVCQHWERLMRFSYVHHRPRVATQDNLQRLQPLRLSLLAFFRCD